MAQPIKRLERVLNHFRIKKVVDFDIEHYTIIQFHKDHYKPIRNDMNKVFIFIVHAIIIIIIK